MYHYFNSITNTRGDALVGYYVKVTDSTMGDTIPIYADSSATPIISVSGIADAAQVDSDGNVSFYIDAADTYDLNIYATDGTSLVRTIHDVAVAVGPQGPIGPAGGAPGETPEVYGAIGDGTTDDAEALQDWLDAGGMLCLPAKTYRSSARLIVRKLVNIAGLGSNWTATAGSVIKFDTGVSGLDVQPETALLTWGNPSTQDGAFGSTFRDFALLGQGAGTAVGFYARTYFHAHNVNVWSFSGKAWDLSASSDFTDGNSEYGNMSNSALYDCGGYLCGSHALNIRGRDANTCTVENFTAFSCGGWGILNESIISNTFIKPNIAGNTLGAMKCPGSTGIIVVTPFIEADGNSNCELNANSIVLGANLNTLNNTLLTSIAVEPELRKTKFVGSASPEVLPAGEYGVIYNWDGLSLAGRGSAKDVTLYNKNGDIALYVETGTTNVRVPGTFVAGSIQAGTSFADIVQSRGSNQGWPGIADGYFALLPMSVNGATLGGYGSSYDTTLTNRSGTVAAGVVANTTNVAVVGDLNVGGVYKVDGTQVVGNQGAAVADATDAASAITQLNALLARLRTHGLIAT